MKMQKGFWLTVLALALLAGLLAPDALADSRRLSVRLEVPFQVGAELYPSGELSLHELRSYNPVATLHEIRIDGHSLGMLVARQNGTPAVSSRDEFIFERSAEGHLVLASVARTGEPVRRLFEIGSDDGFKTKTHAQLVAQTR